MSSKKPAHEVVVEMISKIIRALSMDEDCNDLIMTALHSGILSAELEILEKMIIPEKHRKDVVNALRQIKTGCLLNDIDRLLPDKLFLSIITEN